MTRSRFFQMIAGLVGLGGAAKDAPPLPFTLVLENLDDQGRQTIHEDLKHLDVVTDPPWGYSGTASSGIVNLLGKDITNVMVWTSSDGKQMVEIVYRKRR